MTGGRTLFVGTKNVRDNRHYREHLRDIQTALENAERDRTLAHRFLARADAVEHRLDFIAAEIREVRADVAMPMSSWLRFPKDNVAAIRQKLGNG